MNILNTLIQIVIALLVIITPVGIILGIVFAIKASDEEDKKKKRETIWWMVISFVAPILLLFITLSIWGLVNILTRTLE